LEDQDVKMVQEVVEEEVGDRRMSGMGREKAEASQQLQVWALAAHH